MSGLNEQFVQSGQKLQIQNTGPFDAWVSGDTIRAAPSQTLSQAIISAVEKRDAQIKRLQSEIKELSELRDALASAKHLPMHILRQLLG